MERHGRDPRSLPIAESRDIYVAENEEQAWEEGKDHLHYVASLYREWGEADRQGSAPLPPLTYDELRRTTFIGNPEQIVGLYKARIERYPEFTHSILRVPAGMEHKKVLRFMELFAREVMPALQNWVEGHLSASHLCVRPTAPESLRTRNPLYDVRKPSSFDHRSYVCM